MVSTVTFRGTLKDRVTLREDRRRSNRSSSKFFAENLRNRPVMGKVKKGEANRISPYAENKIL
jgi:hypothetical protein